MILEGFYTLLTNLLLFTSRIENSNSFPHPLSSEKEKEYLEKYKKDGDIEARNILVKHNLRLVVFIAKKYINYPDNEDLISIGTMGLIKAINTFDMTKGSQLATYASRCIENEILMTMRIYKKRAQDISIYDSLSNAKSGAELPIIDILRTDEDSVYSKIDEEFLNKTIKSLIQKNLSERESHIICERFGLKSGIPKTQQTVADSMGISRSYISRIEKRALEKLKKAIEKEKIQL